MKMKKILALGLICLLALTTLCACKKENKYVNVGVEMSTPGMSLYLTNVANKLESISTYMYMESDVDSTLAKLCKDKQGIDIAYFSVENLSKITADMPVVIVAVDCLSDDGSIAGVWVARKGWLKNAPNYSYRYIRGIAKSIDYRYSHMSMSYADALASVKGVKDIRFSADEGNTSAMVVTDVMQYMAAFEEANGDKITDKAFKTMSVQELLISVESGDLKGRCQDVFNTYCKAKTFEEMFDLSLFEKALKEVGGVNE